MPARVDKVLVTNASALKQKYKAAGYTLIKKAIRALVAADKQRGLTTRLVALDDAQGMKKLKASAVKLANDPQQNKTAIDGVFKALVPDYLVILGAPDVVPHQDLKNPVVDDPDSVVDSDLPYACEASYSKRINDFVGPTRVLGRLPDVTGANEPSYLIDLLNTAANHQSRPRDDYEGYLGISAKVWNKSTALSLKNLFGSSTDLALSPLDGPNWPAALLSRRSHFINCHGNPADPQFYGQAGSRYPVAHQAARLKTDVSEGTVTTAECCYGAELYDPNSAGNQLGICQTYLANKAYGFFGSSTIAYGPPSGNGQADLICQYFLKHVLEGASLGRAALQSRQDFVIASGSLDPVELKTLAQFSLMGDPAIHAVEPSATPQAVTKSLAKSAAKSPNLLGERSLRRGRLFQLGLQLPSLVSTAVAHKTPLKKSVKDVLSESAAAFQVTELKFTSFVIPLPKVSARAKSILSVLAPSAIHLAVGSLPSGHDTAIDADPRRREWLVVVAREENGRLHVSEFVSR